MSDETKDIKKEETTSEELSTKEELETEESVETETEESTKQSTLELRLQELTEDSRRQKELLHQLMLLGQQSQQGVTPQDISEDDSAIDPAVVKKLNAMQKQQTQQFQGMIGGVFEEMDRTAILSSSKAELYRKYQQEVESFRQQMSAQGRFFKREEALATVLLNKGMVGETVKPKKLVKQQIKAGGETQQATSIKKTEEKPKSVKEKLAGLKF